MSDLITYDDKIRLKSQNVSEKYKVTAGDMNEIKSVVNTNVELVDEINKPENWVSVGATAPTDGRRVWFEYSRNILPENLYMATRTLNGITYTNNGDGTISFSGTATANTSIQIIPDSKMSFKAGQPYYLYSSVPYNSTTFNLSIALTENGATRYLLANGTYTPTYNSTQARLSLYVPNGTTINATNVKLMLIEGNTAPSEYEPYVEPSINVDGEELNFDNYSTSEQVIGKWIDGKNIYRKTYQVTNISSSNVDLVDVSDLNFDTIIKLYGFIRSNPGMCMPMPLTDSSTNYNVLFIGGSKIRGRVVFGTGGSVRDCYVTIEYTKK